MPSGTAKLAVDPALFSTGQGEWGTPQYLFDHLHSIYRFTIDLAATAENAKLQRFYTKEQDSLAQDWTGERGFLNPPYGRLIGKFVAKAHAETLKCSTLTVVLLIPARTDTKWWHAHCALGEVRFIKGRLKFENPALPSWRADGNFKLSPAPFPSAIVVFGAKARTGTTSYVVYKEPPTSP